MKRKRKDFSAAYSRKKRFLLGSACIIGALTFMACGWFVPFLFETPSMLYKLSINKLFLRMGKLLGVTGATLLFFQILLVSRFKFLDRIFALNRLYAFHRANGIVIGSLVLLHGILILASEDFVLFTFEKRYWPEFLGIFLLVLILVIVTTAWWREIFRLNYEKWARVHRIVAPSAIAILFVHVLFVSETFKSGIPRAAALVAGAAGFLLWTRILYRRFFPGDRFYTVSRVQQAGKDAYSLDLKPNAGRVMGYLPGQFAFITPFSENVPREEHPFTIASSPSRPGSLKFIIRSTGDWTNRINRLKPGEKVLVDGAFGLFSHMAAENHGPMIMIAGGIGITPMLSMLRYMADVKDERNVLLIWSNRKKAHIVFPDEFEDLEHRLAHLRILYVFTKESVRGCEKGRLDRIKLEKLLEGWSRGSSVYICGPPRMMREVGRAMKNLGFSSRGVFKEVFKL